MNKIKLLLIDDSMVVRSALRYMIATQSDIEVTGEAATGQVALQLLLLNSYDGAIVDLNLPDYDGVDLIARLKGHGCCVMVVTADPVRSDEAIRAGADDWFDKSAIMTQQLEFFRRIRKFCRVKMS